MYTWMILTGRENFWLFSQHVYSCQYCQQILYYFSNCLIAIPSQREAAAARAHGLYPVVVINNQCFLTFGRSSACLSVGKDQRVQRRRRSILDQWLILLITPNFPICSLGSMSSCMHFDHFWKILARKNQGPVQFAKNFAKFFIFPVTSNLQTHA